MFNLERQPLGPTREEFCRIVQQEIGSPGHLRIMEYHRSAFGPGVHFGDGDREKAWCGLFCLWGLHEVRHRAERLLAQRRRLLRGAAPGTSSGRTCRVPRERLPEPGDVAYYDLPYRHHAVVISVDPRRRHLHELRRQPGGRHGGAADAHPAQQADLLLLASEKLLQHDTEPAPPPDAEE
jgi:hypothetical protein